MSGWVAVFCQQTYVLVLCAAGNESNMNWFLSLCDQVWYSGCTDVNNLIWTQNDGSLTRGIGDTTTCSLL